MITVLTYGTFDLLHYGHINLLRRCKELGDYLIVGVSTDEFCVYKNKQTVLSTAERIRLVQSLIYPDLVIEEHSMAQKIEDIKKYKADIFVLGDDYKDSFCKMPEYEEVSKLCKIIFLPRTENISSTKLKQEYHNRGYNEYE